MLSRALRSIALVAIAVAAAWPSAAPASAVAGTGTRPCGPATDGIYLSTALGVALRISEGERGSAGQTVGEGIFSVETAHSYLGVVRAFSGAEAMIRASATDQIAGTVVGPAKLPTSGPISHLGATYQVASFPASIFPAQSLRVYMLLRGRHAAQPVSSPRAGSARARGRRGTS